MKTFSQRFQGFSIIEIMVGLAIGLIAILVIGQVTATFEAQKRTNTGGGDAQTNGATALQMLEQEVRMGGLGLINPGISENAGNFLCPLGVNIYYDGNVVSNPGVSAPPVYPMGGFYPPVRILDGGAGADQIVVARSDAELGGVPSIVKKTVNFSTSPTIVTVDVATGYQPGQVFLLGAGDGSKICSIFQVAATPTQNGDNWDLAIASGFPYNSGNPLATFATIPSYEWGDKVVNMGFSPLPPGKNLTGYRPFSVRQYSIRTCDQQPMLSVIDPTQIAAPTCANADFLADQIVDLQAQYGIAPTGSQEISEWRNASGIWDSNNLTAINAARIKAIRLAVVAQSSDYLKNNDASCSENPIPAAPSVQPQLPLWEQLNPGDDVPAKFTVPIGGDGCQHHRYRIFTSVVPLRNVVWGGI